MIIIILLSHCYNLMITSLICMILSVGETKHDLILLHGNDDARSCVVSQQPMLKMDSIRFYPSLHYSDLVVNQRVLLA